MKTLQDIQRQVAAGEYEFSRHAFRRAVERNISEQEIREAGAQAEIVEEYSTPRTSIRRACFCWVSARLDGLCTSKYRMPIRH